MKNRHDGEHMARALKLASRGSFGTFPNPRVGCVVVRGQDIVGQGWHEKAGEAHAEVHALNQAGDAARDATVYVTLEPCCHQGRTGPCVDLLINKKVGRVVVAMPDPNPKVSGRGLARLERAGIEVEVGLMAKQAEDLNRGFVSRMRRRRPFVTLKLAASLDGRTAMASGESQWITGPDARADAHRLRAQAGAVLCTSATVLADNPALTVRQCSTPRQPDRIILDAQGRVPFAARVWQADGARRICVSLAERNLPNGVEPCVVPSSADGRIDLDVAFRNLADREINSVLVECGPVLAGSLLGAGHVDEVLLYLAPNCLGESARGLARLPQLERLADRVRMEFTDVRRVADDLRIVAVPKFIRD